VRPELSICGAAERVEGPLLFLRRTVSVGLNEAVTVTGSDGGPGYPRYGGVPAR
jgi:V/A-type H+-transporting ATPase subunit B